MVLLQPILTETPVLTAHLEFAPYQTVAVLPVGIRQVPFSLAHRVEVDGGVEALTVMLRAALVVTAPVLS